MKKNILKVMIVAGLIALTADLHAFTAVTSGLWSNAATWGGVGPGTNVSNQDIIIPSGITVDLDVNVDFNGSLNTFWVTGTLMSTNYSNVNITAGTLTGTGTLDLGNLNFAGATAFYSFTGPVTAEVMHNHGALVNLASTVVVEDTLDLDQGAVIIGTGADLQLVLNTQVVVNAGILTNSGGAFTTAFPFDVWYFGGTKVTGEELNSSHVRDMNVMLNSNGMDLVLSGNAEVNGTMNMVNGIVMLNGNRLRLQGDLTRNTGSMFNASGASDLVINGYQQLSSALEFESGSSLDELIINSPNNYVHFQDELTVTNAIRLQNGVLLLDPLSNLTMGAGGLVSISFGDLGGTGTFDGSATYSLEYIGVGDTMGMEATTGLTNLRINLYVSFYRVLLSGDLTIPGSLTLESGILDIDSNALVVTGTFNQQSSSAIWGNGQGATLKLLLSSSTNDTLWMGPSYPGLYDFQMDIPNHGTLTLGYNMTVTHNLTITDGKLDISDYLLTLAGTSTITGTNDTNYIVTSGSGEMRRYVYANSTLVQFPIGTPTHFAPIALSQASPGSAGYFRVRVMNGVWTNGFMGTDISTTDRCVNKTWVLSADSGASYNSTVNMNWLTNCEMNGFDRSQAYIKQYDSSSGVWDSYAPSAAMSAPFNMWGMQRIGLAIPGALAIVDTASPLNVQPVVVTEGTFNVYPNPSNDFLNVDIYNPDGNNYQYELYDAAGRRVMSAENSDASNRFDLHNYDRGSYTLRIINVSTNEVITRMVIKS